MLVLLTALAAAAETLATQPVQKDNDPIICKRENPGSEVGTHMRPKKVCLRKSDRDFIEKQAQSTVQKINNRGDGRLRDIPTPR